MKMGKITDDIDNDGQKVLKLMAKMQREAEEQPSTNTNPIFENKKIEDSTNYWKIDKLPSLGRLYPPNTLIEARPLKVLEVKKLASINDTNADYVINDIIKRCVRVSGEINNVGELYLADKLFIIFWLRGVTYRDSSYTVDFSCPKCKKNSRYHFEIKNLEVKYIKDSYDPETIINLESGDKIQLRFLKIKDEFDIERFIQINNKLLGEIDTDLLGLACMITTINGNDKLSLMEKYNFVLDMTPCDLSFITTYLDDYGIGIESNMNVECKECGGVSPMGVTFHPDFTLPKYTTA